jgi:hypothetical protein
LPAGRVTAVLFRAKTPKTAAGIWEGPAWTDSSGTYWLLAAGNQLGWVRQGQFHPLQPASSVTDAAWWPPRRVSSIKAATLVGMMTVRVCALTED